MNRTDRGALSTLARMYDYIKSVWGIISALTPVVGSIATIPIALPQQRTLCVFWAICLSVVALVGAISLWLRGTRPHWGWALLWLSLGIAALGFYAFLADYLTDTSIPTSYPHLTDYVMAVIFGIGFASLTIASAIPNLRR